MIAAKNIIAIDCSQTIDVASSLYKIDFIQLVDLIDVVISTAWDTMLDNRRSYVYSHVPYVMDYNTSIVDRVLTTVEAHRYSSSLLIDVSLFIYGEIYHIISSMEAIANNNVSQCRVHWHNWDVFVEFI